MKRLAHIVFSVLTVVSALLCVTTVALWARSYWVGETLQWQKIWQRDLPHRWVRVSFSSGRGGLRLDFATQQQVDRFEDAPRGLSYTRDMPPFYPYMGIDGPPPRLDIAGLIADWQHREDDDGSTLSTCWVVAPYWALLLIVALPLVPTAFRAWRRRGQNSTNRCHSCGYDMRATPDRCPECGTKAPATSIASHQ